MDEFEKKIMISFAEYNLIRKLGFGFGAVETQTNYYYDTDELKYNENNITLRIREKNGEFVATVKKHYTEPQDYSTEETADCRDENDAVLFRNLGVKLQGKLITERCVSEPKRGVRIMMDHNRYLGSHDFEIEIEYDESMVGDANSYIESIADCLARYGLIERAADFYERYKHSMNKSQRFFRRLSASDDANKYVEN